MYEQPVFDGPSIVTLMFSLLMFSVQLSVTIKVGAVIVGLQPLSPLSAVVEITGATLSSVHV